MITSLSWLKNHLVTKAGLNQVAERLTEIGLEVENIKSSNVNLDNFVICKIVKSEKHPNADKLKLCEVDVGSGNLVRVVCGGQNAKVNSKQYQGYAFGVGIDRLAMLKYGINDLRAFFESDIRWLEFYGFDPLDIPTNYRGLSR